MISGGTILTACPQPATSETAALTLSEDKERSSPADLFGLTEQEASELLGPATWIESRAPAQIWHYENSRCKLDLVFFMEMLTGLMRTLHYDFKNGAENPVQQQVCVTAIVQENSKGVPSDKPPQMMTASTTESDASQLPMDLPINNEASQGARATSIDSAIPAAAPSANPQASGREQYFRRGRTRHRSGWYTAQHGGWRFTLSQRSYFGWASRDAALTTGWSGGRFGPAPYSASSQ